MPWIILIAVIFVALFVMILLPKATKSYTGKKDLTNIAWSKGFKRIYFLLSGIWMSVLLIFLISDGDMPFIPGLLFVLAPIPLYYFIKWIIGGFKKNEKSRK